MQRTDMSHALVTNAMVRSSIDTHDRLQQAAVDDGRTAAAGTEEPDVSEWTPTVIGVTLAVAMLTIGLTRGNMWYKIGLIVLLAIALITYFVSYYGISMDSITSMWSSETAPPAAGRVV